MSWRSFSDGALAFPPGGGSGFGLKKLLVPFPERMLAQGFYEMPLEDAEFDINSPSMHGYHRIVSLPRMETTREQTISEHRQSASDIDLSDASFLSDSAILSDSAYYSEESYSQLSLSASNDSIGLDGAPSSPQNRKKTSSPLGIQPVDLSQLSVSSSGSRSSTPSLRTIPSASPPRSWRSVTPSLSPRGSSPLKSPRMASLKRQQKLTKGWLHKRGRLVRSFQRRWFVMTDRHIRYYGDRTERDPRGIIDLANVLGVEEGEKELEFRVRLSGRVFVLKAESATGKQSWMERIKERAESKREKSKGVTVSLKGKNLTSLPRQAISKENLTTLNLRQNCLTELPQELLALSSLTRLDISRNSLSSLPADIGLLSELRYFNVANNRLSALPASIGLLSNLHKLILGEDLTLSSQLPDVTQRDNQLTELPSEMGSLTRLTHLSLACNRLTDLPSSLRFLVHLEELDLSSNQVTRLPYWLQFLSQLRVLRAHSNLIKHIPCVISRLRHLREVNLIINKVDFLPLSICLLPSLQKLTVDDTCCLRFTSQALLKQKSHSSVIESLHRFRSSSFSPALWRIAAFGVAGSGKSSLLQALVGSKRMTETHANESLGTFESGRVFSRCTWQPREAPGLAFAVQDISSLGHANHLAHLVAPKSAYAVLLIVFPLGGSALDEVAVEEQMRRMRNEYPSAVRVLVGTQAGGKRVPGEEVLEAASQLAGRHGSAFFFFDQAAAKKCIRPLRQHIAEVTTVRQEMLQQSLPVSFLIARDSLLQDSTYFGDQPYLPWASWVAYLRHCGCDTLPEAAEATEYLASIGEVICLQSEERSWVVLSLRWALEVTLLPPLAHLLPYPAQQADVSATMMEAWHEAEPAFRECLETALAMEMQRHASMPI